MKAKFKNWKKSRGIKIPSYLIKPLDLNNYDEKIILEKKTNNISLAEKFAKYNGENLAKDFAWDDAKGREIL